MRLHDSLTPGPAPRLLLGVALVALLLLAPGDPGAAADEADTQEGLRQIDEYTIAGPRSFIDGYFARPGDMVINVVVEIPAGTNAKWEVRKKDGALAWEFKNGEPRVVEYLPYPSNYGMIPRTLLAKDEGGDGDPLDVILLGPSVPRGSVIGAWPIGILHLMDDGEVDDKVLAVVGDGPLDWHRSLGLDDVRENYPGVLEIVEIWFSSYKGPGKMESKGFGDARAAWEMIEEAIDTFEEVHGPPVGHE